MLSRKRFSVLREPVHGDVYLTHEELVLLDTAPMQRLRGIKQLGSAWLVYPGAVHTRFDHSIGTVHVTQRMIESIERSFEPSPAANPDESASVAAGRLHRATTTPSAASLSTSSLP